MNFHLLNLFKCFFNLIYKHVVDFVYEVKQQKVKTHTYTH